MDINMSKHDIADLGTLVSLFVVAGQYRQAQLCLDETQQRLTMMRELGAMSAEAKTAALTKANLLLAAAKLKGESRIARQLRPNDLLLELPFEETKEPTLKHTPQKHDKKFPGILESTGHKHPAPDKTLAELAIEKQAETAPAVEAVKIAAETQPEPGLIRDEDGKVTHISVQPGEPGYDSEIHENTALKIFCDGQHIETAHTADTIKGVVKYYKKDEQGRIKTLTAHGKVEIRGL